MRCGRKFVAEGFLLFTNCLYNLCFYAVILRHATDPTSPLVTGGAMSATDIREMLCPSNESVPLVQRTCHDLVQEGVLCMNRLGNNNTVTWSVSGFKPPVFEPFPGRQRGKKRKETGRKETGRKKTGKTRTGRTARAKNTEWKKGTKCIHHTRNNAQTL
jgi:hypothetical protein